MTQEMIDHVPMMIEEMRGLSTELAQMHNFTIRILPTARIEDNDCFLVSCHLYDRMSESLYHSSILLNEATSYLEELLAMRKEAEENGRR